ncbi:RnfABCDGE type electron transport complex subunit D [Litorimonas sp.]|uniref:RnfABCDGE type electron transport complex subunit D n=1 Tax=Litorimonas sp. TaxID=1892381 RepID=UPI003A891C19
MVTEQGKRIWTAVSLDPRHYQIGVLTSLILLGLFHFGFDLAWWHVAGCVGSTLVTQAFADRIVGRRFDPRSPLISALSLTLLLRTGSLTLSIAAGVLAVASKYILRWNGKHIFNPANFGLVILSLLFTSAWISPGQWGAAPLFALLLLGLGGMVTGKAKRWDISLALLGSYGLLVCGRALWLGDPLTIPVHQMQSGALLVFAFFMISDPKTTPDARAGRLVYAAIVAAVGFTIQFGLYNAGGIILSLILTAPLVPIIDKIFKAERYAWPTLSTPLSFRAKSRRTESEYVESTLKTARTPATSRRMTEI